MSKTLRILLVIIGACALYAIFTFSSMMNPPSPPREIPPAITLNITVTSTGGAFIFRNRSAFPLTNVQATINGKYSVTVGDLAAHVGELSVPALEFVTRDNIRFNPYQLKAAEIRVTAMTPDGRGTWTGGWQ